MKMPRRQGAKILTQRRQGAKMMTQRRKGAEERKENIFFNQRPIKNTLHLFASLRLCVGFIMTMPRRQGAKILTQRRQGAKILTQRRQGAEERKENIFFNQKLIKNTLRLLAPLRLGVGFTMKMPRRQGAKILTQRRKGAEERKENIFFNQRSIKNTLRIFASLRLCVGFTMTTPRRQDLTILTPRRQGAKILTQRRQGAEERKENILTLTKANQKYFAPLCVFAPWRRLYHDDAKTPRFKKTDAKTPRRRGTQRKYINFNKGQPKILCASLRLCALASALSFAPWRPGVHPE